MTDRTRLRVAVAEQEQQDVLAARLGRAVKFALFDARGGEIRGPFYRVRHDNPGDGCDQHAELAALLHDCQAVISGSAGPHMHQRLQALGIDVVTTAETRAPLQLVRSYLAGTLSRIPVACHGSSSRPMPFPVHAS